MTLFFTQRFHDPLFCEQDISAQAPRTSSIEDRIESGVNERAMMQSGRNRIYAC